MIFYSLLSTFLREYQIKPFLPPKIVGKKTHDTSDRFPKLFNELFKLSPSQFELVNTIHLFGYYNTLLTDLLIDEDQEINIDILFSFETTKTESLRLLYSLVKDNKNFWMAYTNYQKEFISACLKESREHFGKISDYSLQDFESISAGKTAYAKVIPMLMAAVSGFDDIEVLKKILSSVDLFSIALQCRDDFSDWKEDLSEKRYSKLLTDIFQENNLDAQSDVSKEFIGKIVYYTKGVGALEAAITYYNKALNEIKDTNLKLWKNAINLSIKECTDQKNNLQKLIYK